MLELWTRESCLAAIAASAPKSVSLSGSRSSPGHVAQQIALGTGNHRQLLAAAVGTPGRSRNPSAHRNQGFGSRLHSPDRRQSASTPNGRTRTSSSAGVRPTVKVEDLKRVLNGGGPAMSFISRVTADDTASDSLVDVDEGSDEGGYVTPPSRGESQQRHGENDYVAGQAVSEKPPVLNLPDMGTESDTKSDTRPVSSYSTKNGRPKTANGTQRPASSRGGASVKSRPVKTKQELRALLEGVKTDEDGGATQDDGFKFGSGGPPY